jgi:MFS family permease
MIALFALYGIYTALTSGAERALISEISPSNLKGTMLGMHATLVGMALLPASIIAGFLWDVFGAASPFIFGGSIGLLSSIAVFVVLNTKNPAGTSAESKA